MSFPGTPGTPETGESVATATAKLRELQRTWWAQITSTLQRLEATTSDTDWV